jgi:hypothetical protein
MNIKMICLGVFVFLVCCKNKNGAKNETHEITTDTTEYFPVIDYIKSEIRYVDSLPVGIKKYTTINRKTDLTYIKPEEFHRLAGEFLPEELNKEAFQKQFTETSFLDRATQTSTFMYNTKNATLELQRVDVLSSPGEVYDKIKSIYMEKVKRNGDTTIVKKLYWQSGKSFQVNIATTVDATNPKMKLVKVVWDY